MTDHNSSLNSMTGFANGAATFQDYRLSMDIKSVNAKGLDVRVRVPPELDGLDLSLKKWTVGYVSRGSVTINVQLTRDADSGLSVDEAALKNLISTLGSISDFATRNNVEKARLDGLLQVRGVVTSGEAVVAEKDRTALSAAFKDLHARVMADLQAARAREGAALAALLAEQVVQLQQLAQSARDTVGDRDNAIKARYQAALARLQKLEPPVSDDRLAQELALVAVKLDITEELDRLDAHLVEAQSLLQSGEPVGRRLDFLCQELNREANTLCSKASDGALTRLGLDMKLLIDQFREQIQNIE